MLPITTVPDKKVPTHGPGTTAWYRGNEAKILAIENGKAKIFCDGRVLLVNYTSLDDASFKTLHETYRVVDNETHKALFTGTKDECESFISDECDEDADVECIELKEAIMVPSDGMNPQYTLEKALSYARGNAAAMIATNPLLYGIAALQRKYVVVCNVLDGEGTENPAYKKLDKDVRAKYHKLLSIPGESGKKYEVFGNKYNTSFLLYYEDAFTTNWFVPAAGKINESIMVPSDAMDKDQTLGDLVADLRGNVAAQFASNPVLAGIATLQRNYVPVWDYDYETETESKEFKNLDKDIRSKFHKILSIPGIGGIKYEVYANKDNTSYLLCYSDMSAKGWYVPASGKINESEAQDKYQEFFKKKLADYGVSSPAELSAEDKSKFFSEIKKEWPDAKMNEAFDIKNYQKSNVVIVRTDPKAYKFFVGNGKWSSSLADAKVMTGAQADILINGEVAFEKEPYDVFDLPANPMHWKAYADVAYKNGDVYHYKYILNLMRQMHMNESLKNKTLFDKIEKWYSALSVDQKETLFYNLFRFSGQATKMAKKYKTLAQLVKMDTKNTPESTSYKHTGIGTVNAIAAYYQSFKTEKDILPKLASIKMDNSKDYLKYHDLAKGTVLNESSKKETVIKAPETYGSITKGTPVYVFAVNDKKVEASGQKRFLIYTVDGKRAEQIVVDRNDNDFNTLNEAEMAFGIGSTVSFNGKKCKVVSISNGVCKLVCDGEVMTASMGDLQPSNPINESADNESAFNAYIHFEDTLKLAKTNLPADIFKLFAKECFINGNAYILDKIVEETLKVVDASPVNDLVKMAKTYNNGNYSDRINKFIYNTNNLRSLQTGTPFNQRYFDKCMTILMKFGTNPSAALDEITADSMMFVPAKNQLEFFDLSTDCIDAIKFVVSKQSDWYVVKQTPTRIVIAVN